MANAERKGEKGQFIAASNFPQLLRFVEFDVLRRRHDYISVNDFPELFKSMDTMYCEEEHARTLKR